MHKNEVGVLFIPLDGKFEFRNVAPCDFHATELRKYILIHHIDIDHVEDRVEYSLSIELLNRGIMTFQYEDDTIKCFLPKEITEAQYMSYKSNKKIFKRVEVAIIDMDKDVGLRNEYHTDLNRKEGYFALDKIIEEKDFIVIENIKETGGKLK